MGKQAKKLADFFGARRRKCTLVRSELLISKGKEKRMKLSVSMPMSGSELSHCPEPFLTQHAVMEKQDSALNRARVDVEFDSMAARIFSTDAITDPTVIINGALIHKFAMVGEGVGEKRTVALEFLLYLPAPKALYDWAYDATHGDFFLESVKAQGSLDLSGEVDDEEGDEDEESPLDTEEGRSGAIRVVPPPAAKSGPKDLAQFHAGELERGAAPKPRQIEPPETTRRRPGMRPN